MKIFSQKATRFENAGKGCYVILFSILYISKFWMATGACCASLGCDILTKTTRWRYK